MPEKCLIVGYENDKKKACLNCQDNLDKPRLPIFTLEVGEKDKCSFCGKEFAIVRQQDEMD